MSRLLVVDDEPRLGRVLAEALALDGHSVVEARGGRAALVELAAGAFDLVLTDLKMPELDGLAVLAQVRAKSPTTPVIVMTAWGTTESAVAAMKAGASDYLTKPFANDELRLRVRRLVAQRDAERKADRLVERLTPALVAESPAMRAALEAARRVAATDATVLLTGETGTGKSQLARFIHFVGPRGVGPLVEVHCAALPETLLETELFGHVKGAFTGADARRDGHLAQADGGTVFLDEIGEVTPPTQVKLLRFLQSREVTPLGSAEARQVDARTIAATNRNLAAAVKAGGFREDLFYRLNVFAIEVPPLRARKEDIEPLVDRLLGARGLSPERVDAAARRALLAHAWPGNVRELENAVSRALILAGSEPVTPRLLELQPRDPGAAGAGQLLGPGFSLDRLERELIAAALERTEGNKSRAAQLLGITRRRLYSRLESLGKSEPDDPEG